MTRDDDLIRKLMLILEQANSYVNDNLVVEGYTRDQIAYHLGLIVRAGYAEGPQPRYSSSGSDPTIPLAVVVNRLSPAGHDFIAALRDDTVWAKVKERLAKVGGSASLDVIGQVGASVAKQMLGLA
ncbi:MULTISPECIES: DUF2513 domain-containing protein [unclassified Pseudoxanthomonas]|uniref:DUF2513 domain-containing protein n=1 Tax=unclassified Pseudoxanthomonas TaxID=2645906 RepID=UPI0008E81702|nr:MULTISPECIES: DUF2513 domain-containing protein [unclassified Pseudoxanthomonas]SFV27765.1 Hypothetical protein SAMN05428990_0781 [Pseudoxanthomonas sp. YR558]